MVSPELKRYIEEARKQNISDDVIKNQLVSVGWQESLVLQGLSSQDGTATTPLPPPPVPHFGMWVGFLYILFFISLYVLATSIGGLLNQWVDKLIPDPASTSYSSSYANSFNDTLIRGYVAAVIVSFPIFVSLAIILKKQSIKVPAVKNLRSRKLLIYLTLVVAFILMIINIISTIYNFLGGTFTSNTLGHLGVTFLVAGSLFFYFLTEVKSDRKLQ